MFVSKSHVIKCRGAYEGEDGLASDFSQSSMEDGPYFFVPYVRSQLFLLCSKMPRAVASVSNFASPSESFLTKRRRSDHAQLGSATMPALAAQKYADHVHTSRRHFSASSIVTNGIRGSPKSISDINLSPTGSTTGDAKMTIRHHDGGPTSMSSSPPSPKGTRLTHVNSDGEAHMVDVGSKGATHRVAIAQGRVRFSNTKPVKLIQENRNKKGDVLGISRIAGLMAAKRTADLIPLCHPLSISKACVDIRITSHAEDEPGAAVQCGFATIQARIDCVGATGVEMEALTAVAVAALTMYDMCKAVDKRMVIEQARLVYKLGGKSGDFVEEEWLERGGRGYIDSGV